VSFRPPYVIAHPEADSAPKPVMRFEKKTILIAAAGVFELTTRTLARAKKTL
jgi:hypothetical protein